MDMQSMELPDVWIGRFIFAVAFFCIWLLDRAQRKDVAAQSLQCLELEIHLRTVSVCNLALILSYQEMVSQLHSLNMQLHHTLGNEGQPHHAAEKKAPPLMGDGKQWPCPGGDGQKRHH